VWFTCSLSLYFRVGMPHSFLVVEGGATLSPGLVMAPPPFGSPAASLSLCVLLERSIGFAPPPCSGFAFLAATGGTSTQDLQPTPM
jgi:hypothetical protein